MGFFRGFAGPFRGAAFIGRERLWHLVAFPVLLNVLLAGGAVWAAGHYWGRELADRAIGSSALATLLLVITTALGTVVLFVLLQPLLGAIFNDHLSERVERRVVGDVAKVPFFASMGRAVVHGILKLVLYGIALVAGLGAGAVTAGLGGLVGVGLGGLFLAYDGFDYPLSRRGAGFGAKWRYLALHPAQTIGYGVGATIFYLIPLALIVAPPLMAVGATLVYLETDKRKRKSADMKRTG
jgi:uncharacterized protein involved in cysteine biosynthesis